MWRIARDRLRGENDFSVATAAVEPLQRLSLLSAVAIVPNGPALFIAVAPSADFLRLRVCAGSGCAQPSTKPCFRCPDDSITTRSFLRSVLESGGYRVRTAADGDEEGCDIWRTD